MTGIYWENNPNWQTYFVHQGWNHELSQFAQVSDKTNRYCRYCCMYLFDAARRWLFCRVRESNETVFPAKSGRRWLDIFGMAWFVLKLYCFAMQIDIPQLMGAFAQKKVASCQCWIRAAGNSLLPQLDRIGMGLVPNNLWRKDNKSNGRENNVPSICLLFGGCPRFRQTHVGQELILKLSFCCRFFLATLCWYNFDFTSHFAKATCFGPSWLACWHFVAFHLLHHCEWRMILLFGDQVTKDSPQRDDRIHILLSASNSVTLQDQEQGRSPDWWAAEEYTKAVTAQQVQNLGKLTGEWYW